MRGIEVVYSWKKAKFSVSRFHLATIAVLSLATKPRKVAPGFEPFDRGSHALGKVAREALILMHFDKVDEAIAAGDAKLLVDHDQESCVRGCYRCLLSYFNQPDHELIDRTHDEAKQMLVDLARGQVVFATADRPMGSGEWVDAFKEAGFPAPDSSTIKFSDQEVSFVWRSHFVAACASPLTESTRRDAEAKGWTLFELPEVVTAGVPDAMRSMFGGSSQFYSGRFGPSAWP